MFRIGLTGNIASGKSSVGRVWRRLGAAVIEADRLARRAVEPGSAGLREIERVFGAEVLTREGELDRAAMREIVFRDPDARERLESIVHPEVARLREEEERRLADEGRRIVVHDVPLLFEADLEDTVDLVVLVDAPASVRLDRIVRDRGLGHADAQRMIEAQMPASEKRGRADLVIDNTGTLQALEERAEEVWREIERRAGGSA